MAQTMKAMPQYFLSSSDFDVFSGTGPILSSILWICFGYFLAF